MVMNDFFEKNLEDIVFDKRDTVHEKGFPKFYKHAQRQFSLPSGKRIDIFTWEVVGGKLFARIIEFKRTAITEDTLWQGIHYHDLLITITAGCFIDYDIDIILIGTDMYYSSNVMFAASLSDKIRLFEYQYSYDGIKFIEGDIGYSKSKADILNRESELQYEAFTRRLKNPEHS